MGEARVVSVAFPLVLTLDNGARVELAEISPPAMQGPPGATNPAVDALAQWAKGQEVRLYTDGAKLDRHGRVLAEVEVAKGEDVWLQKALVEAGLAYVDPLPTNHVCAAELLMAEDLARRAHRGLWADPANRVLDAQNAELGEGHFALVEGRVVAATKIGGIVYLDFGPDWRTDFSVRVPAAAVRLFAKAHRDLLAMKGQWVRVRGYVSWRAGPNIDVLVPEQIEPLGDHLQADTGAAAEASKPR